MLTPDEMRAKIVDKAAEDADFRALLLSDPKSAVEQELGLDIPSGFNVEVHEEGGNTAHLVLPPPSSLGEDELRALAGGDIDDAAGTPGVGSHSMWSSWNAAEW